MYNDSQLIWEAYKPDYWSKPVAYHLDWNINNSDPDNIIMIPRHLYIHLHNHGKEHAEKSGWNNREQVELMLEPYGNWKDYQNHGGMRS